MVIMWYILFLERLRILWLDLCVRILKCIGNMNVVYFFFIFFCFVNILKSFGIGLCKFFIVLLFCKLLFGFGFGYKFIIFNKNLIFVRWIIL